MNLSSIDLAKQIRPFATVIHHKSSFRIPKAYCCYCFCIMIGLLVGRSAANSGRRSAFAVFCRRQAKLSSHAIVIDARSSALDPSISSRRSAAHNIRSMGRRAPISPAITSTTRLFGSRPGSGVEGHIVISNEQNNLHNLDIPAMEGSIRAIREILGYPTYDVALLLTNDKEIREMNYDMRGVNASTDILSFPLMGEEIEVPGILPPPEFDVEDYYCLGDMMISVPYVRRVCESDRKEYEERLQKSEDEADMCDDRGVSGAMSTEFDPETRIHMLLVHGMLHLVGYDHIEDDDYEAMVAKEEEVLRLLREREGSFLSKKMKNDI